jgi:hypothetical protein
MSKLDAAALAPLLPRLELPQAATAIVDGCEAPSAAVAALQGGGFLVEAARLCAYALPPREAVWWAAQCARHTAPAELPEPDRRAGDLAEQWVRTRADREEIGRAAMQVAEQAGYTSPESWAAVAAFWCGESMAPPEAPKVPPVPHLPGTAVAGAVVLASVRGHPDRQAPRLRRFLDSAHDIAAGGAGRLDREDA